MDANPIALDSATLTAVEAVRGALRLATESAGSTEVHAKDGRDVVTDADVAAEAAIRQVLTKRTGLPVVGEEHGGQVPADGSACWLVDPICGTRNYASGMPLWSVNVALAERGTVIAAVVGDASTQQVNVAQRGRDAWSLCDRSLARLTTSEGSRTILVEDGKSAGGRRSLAARFAATVIRADRWDFRSFGSTMSLASIAAGRASGYVTFWLDSGVHAAAGSLLVTEAGGTVSDIAGDQWRLESDSILATASPSMHSDVLSLIASSGASGALRTGDQSCRYDRSRTGRIASSPVRGR
jgi:myo-inositol-1(or 4)-monophosphatase